MAETNIQINVREMEKTDINQFVDYWFKSDVDFLLSMGVDLSKLPSRQEMTKGMVQHIDKPIKEKLSYYLVWELNGSAIGHTNVNQIEIGIQAYMHLHIWNKGVRRKGLGFALARMSIPIFFEKLQLKQLFCEPYIKNEAPHRALKKLGFEFQKKYRTQPGPLSFEQEVNLWCMTRERYLVDFRDNIV